jgi:hypothetical protein
LFFPDILVMMVSINGTPANIIQGTNEMVSRNVRWYNGKEDKGSPKK